ncbi:MAG: hypothetical protein K0Q73_3238 [Paenibacillus sp.]|nr:hypothetical protein [Paenibacillus sp.]
MFNFPDTDEILIAKIIPHKATELVDRFTQIAEFNVLELNQPFWYLINFYDCNQVLIVKAIYDKAEQLADWFGECYELFGFQSIAEMLQEIPLIL